MKKYFSISLIITLASFILGELVSPLLPNRIVTHWGISGNPDGFSDKSTGLIITPLISLAVIALLYITTKSNPDKRNQKNLSQNIGVIVLATSIFLAYLHLLMVSYSLIPGINFLKLLIPAFAALFFFLGTIMKNIKQNYFAGIRTPWTLSSVKNWEKTHKLASVLFQSSAITALLGLFTTPVQAFILLIFPIIMSAMISVAYSYFLFRTKS